MEFTFNTIPEALDALRAGKLPPTYFCYGTEDPF